MKLTFVNKTIRHLAAALLAVQTSHVTPAADGKEKPASPTGNTSGVFYLNEFGKTSTPKDAQAALDLASDTIQKLGGGILIIPPDTAPGWVPKNQGQHEIRVPEAPNPAKTWRESPSVTIVDPRGRYPSLHTAPITGLTLRRVLDLHPGESLPHWNYNPMLSFENIIARGSNSYHDWLQEDVEPGENARFYVPTIRGLYPGMFINANGWSVVERLYIRSLGYDQEKKAWYITADTTKPFKKGILLSNKNHVNILRMDTSSHNENQTFDLHILRKNYSQGDNYLIDARFRYMGDVHSTAGDENGVIYAAFIQSELHAFKAKVDRWDPATGELAFKAGNKADTLGSGRPILNMNADKWITGGSVLIVKADLTAKDSAADPAPSSFNGVSYPNVFGPNHLGINSARVGGLIRFSKDAPVTSDCIGRYFAIDQDDESPKGTKARRWYLIHNVTPNPDGTKDIQIIRHWWGAKPAGSPLLYNPDNYTWDGHERPLKYAIVPGVNAYEVSKALPGPDSKPILMLAPAPFAGTKFDFAADDPIEQAIGPDPFHPQPFRSWTWDEVPSSFPSSYFDIRNLGQVQRHSIMTIGGGTGDLAEDVASRWSHAPVYDRWFEFKGTARNGIVFSADVAGAALLFQQPHQRPQPIIWNYKQDEALKQVSLSVSPENGTLALEGPGAAIPGGLTRIGGISGSETPARNLRSIDAPVPEGIREHTVTLSEPEADAKYGIFLESSWFTMHIITQRKEKSFTVRFSEPTPKNATISWLLTR
jgi:hypothetical protein